MHYSGILYSSFVGNAISLVESATAGLEERITSCLRMEKGLVEEELSKLSDLRKRTRPWKHEAVVKDLVQIKNRVGERASAPA